MRRALVLIAALPAFAQAQAVGGLFATTKPDVTIVVRHGQSGNDVVDVTMQRSEYPPALLQQQAERVAQELGAVPTGLRVFPYQIGSDSGLRFVKANFGVPGLVDRQTGALRVLPFARAFAGAPDPYTVRVLMIQYERERPGSGTLRNFTSKDGKVAVEAITSEGGLGVEYRVKLDIQDPKLIDIPDVRQPQKPKAVAPKPAQSGPDWTLYGVIALAALAVGALVYSMLLRASPKRA